MQYFGENQRGYTAEDRRRRGVGTTGRAQRPFRPWEELREGLASDPGLQAFRWLPDVYLFVKDRERRFVYFSAAFEGMMSLSADKLLGKRDEDLSPEYLVDHYRSDDNAVLTSGIELIDTAELVHNSRGKYDWNITSKWSIHDRSGEIVALAGVTRRLSERTEADGRYLMLTPAVELMVADLSKSVPLAELAATVALSPSQFGRTFLTRFGVTPQEYQRRVRLDAACDLLTTSDLTLAAVAAKCGYYDQSHMTNEFRTRKNMPPGAYRKRFRLR
jgi:PAS domain S-box-containing protein